MKLSDVFEYVVMMEQEEFSSNSEFPVSSVVFLFLTNGQSMRELTISRKSSDHKMLC